MIGTRAAVTHDRYLHDNSSICTVLTAYIFWERINDFIEGQVMDDESSVEWAKENSKENKE